MPPKRPPAASTKTSELSDAGRAGRSTAGRTKRERTRRQVLAAAQRLFAELPYEDVSVTAIAKHANVGLATFYLAFGQKASVLAELLWAEYAPLEATTRADLESGREGAALLESYMTRLADIVAENLGLFNGYAQELTRALGRGAWQPDTERILSAAPALVDDLVRKAQSDGSFHTADKVDGIGVIATLALVARVSVCPGDPPAASAAFILRTLLRARPR